MRYAGLGVALVALTLVAGCNTPSPAMWTAPMQKVSVDGMTFEVRQRDDVVEVARVNILAPGRLRQVMSVAPRAIEQATGCFVVPGTLVGDPALMTAEITCP